MYGNDTYGCCTFAALAHAMRSWTAYSHADGVAVGPSDGQVLDAYFAVSPDDTGADMLTTLKYFSRIGIGGQTILAYAALDVTNHEQVEMAIALFGGVYVGLSLPFEVADAANPFTVSWKVPLAGAVGLWAPDTNAGHAVWAVGYPGLNPADPHLDVITWDAIISMDWNFWSDYVDEAYVLVSKEWIAANGLAPSGFNLAQLLADRAAINGPPTPVTVSSMVTIEHQILSSLRDIERKVSKLIMSQDSVVVAALDASNSLLSKLFKGANPDTLTADKQLVDALNAAALASVTAIPPPPISPGGVAK